MVDVQPARRGVKDTHVLVAMREVPREAFVDPGFEKFAYEDIALPIDEDRTLPQPYVVATMVEAAEVKPGERVLEIGAGSGYVAAVLGRIAERVYAVDHDPLLGQSTAQRLERPEVKRVRPSRADSYERLCHDSGVPCFLLDLGRDRHEALRRHKPV